MDPSLYANIDALCLPVEIFEHIMSVSDLNQLFGFMEIHFTFKVLAILEIKKRLKSIKNLIKKKELCQEKFPICFF